MNTTRASNPLLSLGRKIKSNVLKAAPLHLQALQFHARADPSQYPCHITALDPHPKQGPTVVSNETIDCWSLSPRSGKPSLCPDTIAQGTGNGHLGCMWLKAFPFFSRLSRRQRTVPPPLVQRPACRATTRWSDRTFFFFFAPPLKESQ